ncbi:Vacuolar protein 8 [Entomortierella chlamydospora]|uniref:Vacuolar protein 8 n=1 Tax=Entomortierella chlamydospora TaxID=101097 RepID=A0A9P6MYV1_9FUNG|nr:Vacuolar protein 8 [Entomortierella chlamydospora]
MARGKRRGKKRIEDSLSTLAITSSDNAQQPEAAMFGEDTLQDVEKVDSKALEPLIQSLKSKNSAVLGTVLTTLTRLAQNGVLPPLLRLALSKDLMVQRSVVATLADLAEPHGNRQRMVNARTAPVLISILRNLRDDLQVDCLTTLNYIGFDLTNFDASPKNLVETLVAMSRSTTLKGEQEVSTTFQFLAEFGIFQREIVRHEGLDCLRCLLSSVDQKTIARSLTCINTISNQPEHKSQLINGEFLNRLSELLAYSEMEEIQCKAASTLFRLVHNNQPGGAAILNAGVVERVRELFLDVPAEVQDLMSILVSSLIDIDKLRPRLVRLGVVDIFIYCTASSGEKAPGYGMMALIKLHERLPELQPLEDAWKTPAEGIQGGLIRFLDSPKDDYRKQALMAITFILKGKSEKLKDLVKGSTKLNSAVRRVAQVSAKAIPGKQTWDLEDLINSRVYNIKSAKAVVNMMEGRDP